VNPDIPTSVSGFTHVADELIYDGFVIDVVNGVFTTPEGERIHRDIVRHPGAVGVVALDGDEVVFVRQYRPAIDDELLEIPAGKRDIEGEPPERTAVRELEEEVGLRPATISAGCTARSGSATSTSISFLPRISSRYLPSTTVRRNDTWLSSGGHSTRLPPAFRMDASPMPSRWWPSVLSSADLVAEPDWST